MWTDDWNARIRKKVRTLGFQSLSELLATMPSEGYQAVAKHLNSAPIQIIAIQFAEAKETGNTIDAVKDCLVRNLHESLSDGWPDNPKGNFKVASALAGWSTEITGVGNCPEFEERADRVLFGMLQASIKPGWLPESIFDPTLDEIFTTYWN